MNGLVITLTASDLRGFAAYWKSEGRSATTLSEYLRHLKLYLNEHPGPLSLAEAREYSNTLLDRSRSQGRYAVRALKAFSKWQALEYDKPDALAKLKMPQDDTPDPNRTKVATADDVAKILKACIDANDHYSKRDHAIISVLSSTGMRRSELARMEWQYVDIMEGTITLPKTKNKSARMVRLSPDALRSLKRHAHDFPGMPLWWNLYGRPMTPDAISAVIERRSKAAGIKLTPHTFRRGMAVDYLRKGGSETYLRKLAGWNTPSMVQRYTSLVAQEEALDEHKRLYG